MNPWEISETEYQANQSMFNQLTAGQLYMDTGTARNALMRSNLPTHLLSQIWALSDMDKDGRLDIREYSIAMKLALNCLAGLSLPPQLPPSLLQIPARRAFVGIPINAVNHSSVLATSVSNSPEVSQPGEGRQLDNWAIPHQNKLKYSQLFNSLDKERSGFLNSQVGRNALGMSGLPTNILAHVWFLSDVNKDGKLSVDEYYISQYMIDMFKAGYALPKVTPIELVRMCGINSRSANNTPELESGAEPPQKTPVPRTFEDKRQDNFAKGQAELERRRQILEEEEQRRRAELEKKEREEEARRERERVEKERQAEIERQAEVERQRTLALAREEEERIRREEFERRREEEERQKKIQMEKSRLKQMQNLKQQENERLTQRQQREKTLLFQLQALDEKTTDVELDIGKSKKAVAEVTGIIEQMAQKRNEKVAKIKELQEINQKTAIETQELGHQLLQKQSLHKGTIERRNELELLRRRRDVMKKAIEDAAIELISEQKKSNNQKEILNEGKEVYKSDIHKKLSAKRDEYKQIFELFLHAQTHAKSKVGDFKVEKASIPQNNVSMSSEISSPFSSVAFEKEEKVEQSPSQASAPTSARPAVTSFDTSKTYKCRAVFPFEARSGDELSFEPGDVIIVFENQISEPGWKAGQLKEKVGWFPEAFVEAIAPVPQNTSFEPPIQNMPPNVTPSSSMDQIDPNIRASHKAQIAKVMGTDDGKPTGQAVSSTKAVISQGIAQFQWRARNDEDLSFSKGDVIEILEKQEMKWNGRNPAGETGWFPKSYVKEIQDGPTLPTSPVKPDVSLSKDVVEDTKYDVVPEEVKSFVEDKEKEVYTAIYDFEAAESTDLPLKVGDSIVILEKNDEWWLGRCNGREGMFPANYVEKATPTKTENRGIAPNSTQNTNQSLFEAKVIVEFVASADNQLGIKVGEIIKVREKSSTGWWEGELTRDGKYFCGWFPADYVKTITPTSSASNCLRATALFDYDALQADEISFKTGDIIIITDRSEAEWWSGHTQNSAKSGLFPSNYVEVIKTD